MWQVTHSWALGCGNPFEVHSVWVPVVPGSKPAMDRNSTGPAPLGVLPGHRPVKQETGARSASAGSKARVGSNGASDAERPRAGFAEDVA